MFKFNLPPVITSAVQDKYFRYYAQISVGTTDGANISIVDCSTIPKNAAYTKYKCLDISEIKNLYVYENGTYN